MLGYFGVAGILSEGQPLSIDRIHENVESMGVIADNPIIPHVLTEGYVDYWSLSAERPKVAVVLKGVKRSKIEFVPTFRLELLINSRYRLEPIVIRIFRRKRVKPFLVFGSPRAI